MRRHHTLCILLLAVRGADADESTPSPVEINRAIDAGVAWLKAAQETDGSWGPCIAEETYGGGAGGAAYRLGPTAFSIFTLAVCGVPKNDKVIERGLQWLRKPQASDYEYASYESCAVVLMLTELHRATSPKALVRSASRLRPPRGSPFPAEDWRWMDERVQHVIGCVAGSGGVGYYEERDYADVSATQFACLALRSASLAGYPLPKDLWNRVADFHITVQDPTGGFPYQVGHKPSRGMTAAALSTLLICREQLGLLRQTEPARLHAVTEKGFAYLDANFSVNSNPSPHDEGRSYYHYCYLYAVERAGMLSGRHEFGGQGWYARGATLLVREQDNEGRWADNSCMMPEDVLGTCFALLFLKKATIPVLTPGTPGR